MEDRPRLPGSTRRPPRSATEPLALACEVAARDPALHRAVLPLDRLRRADDRRLLRDPVHRSLSAGHLRFQRRRAALDLARLVLLVRRAGHGPLPAVHARRATRLSGDTRRRIPGAALARARAREVVAARDPAVHPGRDLRRRRRLCGRRGSRPGRVALVVCRRAHRRPRAVRSSRAPLHGAVSPRALRPRPRPRPLGGAGRGVRLPDDGLLSTVPTRPGRGRLGGAAALAPEPSPVGAALDQPPLAVETTAAEPAPRPRGGGGRVALIVVGIVAALLSLPIARRRYGPRRGRSSPARRRRLPDVPERGFLHGDVRHRLRQRRRGLRRLRARRAGDPRRRPHPQRERSRCLRRHRPGHRRRRVPERRRALRRHRYRGGPGVPAPPGRRADLSSRRPGLLGCIHERFRRADARMGAGGRQLERCRHELRRIPRSRIRAEHRSRARCGALGGHRGARGRRSARRSRGDRHHGRRSSRACDPTAPG